MEPQWDDMKVFLAVARESSLSGAGRVLKMDPATVGRRVARFEAALKTSLFVKSPQGYALSAAGDRLLGHAEEAELAMRAGEEALFNQRPIRVPVGDVTEQNSPQLPSNLFLAPQLS